MNLSVSNPASTDPASIFDFSIFPHKSLRPAQLDALLKIVRAVDTGKRFIFAQLPTGTGKSLIAWALGIGRQVTVLVNTHALGEQYAREYGFKFLPGRQTFDCAHPDKIERWARKRLKPTAYDCNYTPMHKCPYASSCPYIVAKEEALAAQRLVVTYQYAVRSAKIWERGGIIVLDECHEAVETLLDVTEIEITRDQQIIYDLPAFPFADIGGFGEDGKGGRAEDRDLEDVRHWADSVLIRLGIDEATAATSSFINEDAETDSNDSGGDDSKAIDDPSPDGAKIKRFKEKVKGLRNLLGAGEWFLRSTSEALYLKALGAELGAYRLFDGKEAVLLMSATMGDPDALAAEMGIDDYLFLDYPHPVPVDYRPVFDLHAPKLTASELRENPELYRVQAMIIARWIKSLDPMWRGLIVSTSNYKVQQLRTFIGGDAKLGSRLYVPRYMAGVSERVSGFLGDPRQGLIAIDTIQGWGHGLDLRGDLARFTVIAGIPYKNPSDPYYRARIGRVGGKKYEDKQAALTVVQADGRAKRGERDQVTGEYLTSYSALADGSCTTKLAMRNYPTYFKEAIR